MNPRCFLSCALAIGFLVGCVAVSETSLPPGTVTGATTLLIPSPAIILPAPSKPTPIPPSIHLQKSKATSSVLAGGNSGRRDGLGEQAQFGQIKGMVLDADGNILIADSGMNVIRRVTMGGDVSTVVGSGRSGNQDGQAAEATFRTPYGIAVDASGAMYIPDRYNGRVRKVTPDGQVLTLTRTRGWFTAPDEGLQYDFRSPNGIAAAPDGTVFVTDDSRQVYQITPDGKISVYIDAGTRGPQTEWYVRAIDPGALHIDASGSLLISDEAESFIWRARTKGAVEALAGMSIGYSSRGFVDGDRSVAQLAGPTGVDFDTMGNMYFCDTANHSVRMLTATGQVITLLGDGRAGNLLGIATEARLSSPEGLVVGRDGCVYVADVGNHRILKISLN